MSMAANILVIPATISEQIEMAEIDSSSRIVDVSKGETLYTFEDQSQLLVTWSNFGVDIGLSS